MTEQCLIVRLSDDEDEDEPVQQVQNLVCNLCKKSLPSTKFSMKQQNKGTERECSGCIKEKGYLHQQHQAANTSTNARPQKCKTHFVVGCHICFKQVVSKTNNKAQKAEKKEKEALDAQRRMQDVQARIARNKITLKSTGFGSDDSL